MAKYVSEDGVKAIRDWAKVHDNKSLYNLGYYDTYDASTNTITRQTGYVDLGSLSWGYNTTGFGKPFFYVAYSNIIEPSNESSIFNGITYKYTTTSWVSMGGGGQNKSICYVAGNIRIKDTSYTDVASFKASLQGVILQYKLTTSYTEEIIEKQPLITLDQQGSQWLRNEWEKGLNLFDFTTANPNYNTAGVLTNVGRININNNGTITIGVNAEIEYGKGFKIPINKNTTYTFSFTKNMVSNLYVEAFQNNEKILAYNITKSGRCVFFFTTNSSSNFIVLAFSTTGSAIGNLTISDLMLNYGDNPYPYQPYNSKAHITNYEADYLKDESLKSANVFNIDAINPNKTSYVEKISDTEFKATWAGYKLFKTNFKENTQYTISGYTKEDNATHGGRLKIFYTDNTSEECLVNYQTSYVYRTHTSQANKTINYIGYSFETGDYYSYYKNLMINEGTTALPYQPYNQNKHITNNEASFLKAEYERSANLMPLGTWTKGLGYTSNGGDNESPDLNRCEDYISVLGNKEYSYRQNITITSYAIVEYDINKNFIKRQVDITTSFITSSNTRYIRIATYINGGCPLPTEYMLNEGSTPYEGKIVHEKGLKTINGNSIVGSGDLSISGTIPIYGVSQLYRHDYEIENQVGDTIYVHCWSTQNTKIKLYDITAYAFSNIQVYNTSNEEAINVLKWETSGFYYIADNGTIAGNSYTVIHYYINGEPTTY